MFTSGITQLDLGQGFLIHPRFLLGERITWRSAKQRVRLDLLTPILLLLRFMLGREVGWVLNTQTLQLFQQVKVEE